MIFFRLNFWLVVRVVLILLNIGGICMGVFRLVIMFFRSVWCLCSGRLVRLCLLRCSRLNSMYMIGVCMILCLIFCGWVRCMWFCSREKLGWFCVLNVMILLLIIVLEMGRNGVLLVVSLG